MTQEQEWLMSAEKQPKKRQGNVPAEGIKKQQQKQQQDLAEQKEMAKKTREGACRTVTRTKILMPLGKL